MKKFFLLIFFLTLFVPSTVKAVEFVDQSNWDNDTSAWLPDRGTRTFCQSFIPQQSNVSAVGVAASYQETSGNDLCYYYDYSLRSDSCSGTVLGTTDISQADCTEQLTKVVTTPDNKFLVIHFASPIVVTPGQTYYITSANNYAFNFAQDYDLFVQFGKNASNVFLGQQAYNDNNGGSYTAGIKGYDNVLYPDANLMFMTLWDDGLISTTTQAWILEPTADATKTSDEWTSTAFTGFVPNSYTTDVSFQFQILTSTTTVVSTTGWTLPANTFITDNPFHMAQASAFVNYNFPVGTYYVQTRAKFNSESQITDWSEMVRFYSTGGNYYQDCGATDLFCHIQNAFVWAFTPDETTMKNFASSTQVLLNSKQPFSYFYLAKDAISSITAASSTVSLDLDFTMSGIDVHMPFIDTEEPNLANFLDSVRPIFIAGLWIMFLIYLFERIADLEI